MICLKLWNSYSKLKDADKEPQLKWGFISLETHTKLLISSKSITETDLRSLLPRNFDNKFNLKIKLCQYRFEKIDLNPGVCRFMRGIDLFAYFLMKHLAIFDEP